MVLRVSPVRFATDMNININIRDSVYKSCMLIYFGDVFQFTSQL